MSSRRRLVVVGLVAGAHCARMGTVGMAARHAGPECLLAEQECEAKLVPQERVQQRAVGEEVVPSDFAATLDTHQLERTGARALFPSASWRRWMTCPYG